MFLLHLHHLLLLLLLLSLSLSLSLSLCLSLLLSLTHCSVPSGGTSGKVEGRGFFGSFLLIVVVATESYSCVIIADFMWVLFGTRDLLFCSFNTPICLLFRVCVCVSVCVCVCV